MNSNINIQALEGEYWDAIIVGAGMSGATLGYQLAKQGQKILFLEKGLSLLSNEEGLRGDFAESFFPAPAAPSPEHKTLLQQAGRYVDYIDDQYGKKAIPFVGSGGGGSSALYGAALERLFPSDFEPRANHPNASDTTLPEAWPISYQELLPFYEQAEHLYRVHGGGDTIHPCGNSGHIPSPALQAANEHLKSYFESIGLHPYQLPQACEFVEGCQGCQGFLCPRNCKNDSNRICLQPAIREHQAVIADNCDVHTLHSNGHHVDKVLCRIQGEPATLCGKVIVLAAGALDTPRLLINSSNKQRPKGLANSSGLVGHNLMRHYVDLYAFPLDKQTPAPGNLKELALNDFYQTDEGKFGTLQSFGALPNSSIIAEEILHDLREGKHGWLTPFAALGKPVIKTVLSRLLSRRVLFASIMEDLPYLHNKVGLPTHQDHRTSIQYRLSNHEKARILQFRQLILSRFASRKPLAMKQAENHFRLGHACGTCRFGESPNTSVLDKDNRCHDLDNLYVIDASFLPSSGGTNPSLTLAANALRVAQHIINR